MCSLKKKKEKQKALVEKEKKPTPGRGGNQYLCVPEMLGTGWQVGGFSLSFRGGQVAAGSGTQEALPRTTGSCVTLSRSLPFLDSVLPPVKWVKGRCPTRTEY